MTCGAAESRTGVDDTAVIPGRSLAKDRVEVGMAFQSLNCIAHLTVRENVMLAPRLLSHPREPRT